jgi:hypothetical protein
VGVLCVCASYLASCKRETNSASRVRSRLDRGRAAVLMECFQDPTRLDNPHEALLLCFEARSPEMVGECEISGQKEHLSFRSGVEPRPWPRCLGEGVFLGPTWAVERARHPDVCFATVVAKITGSAGENFGSKSA